MGDDVGPGRLSEQPGEELVFERVLPRAGEAGTEEEGAPPASVQNQVYGGQAEALNRTHHVRREHPDGEEYGAIAPAGVELFG